MFDWIPVVSAAMTAIGYSAGSETIYFRFTDHEEWWSSARTEQVWDEFTAPGVSAGDFCTNVLNPNRMADTRYRRSKGTGFTWD